MPQQRDWRRPSSVRFWRLDLSCGAGSISTPVLAEHQKNASEIAVLGEGAFSMLCSCLPKYILLSGLAIITRELTSRETTAVVLRSLESTEAKPRAEALSKSLRSSLDTRISRVLAGGGFGDTRGLWERVVAMEMAEVGLSVSNDGTVLSNITSFEDLVNNPVARTLVRLRPPRPGCPAPPGLPEPLPSLTSISARLGTTLAPHARALARALAFPHHHHLFPSPGRPR